VWVSVTGASAEVQNIADGLSAIDPAHSTQYKNNSEAFITRLQSLQTRMKEALSNVSNTNIVTFHEAFPYFAKEFGLNIVAQIESEPGAEPGAGQVADYIKTIKSSNVKALFVDIQYTSSTAEVISRETGLKLYPLNPVVVGPLDADGGEYISIMEENLKTLSEALK
jgi:zinc transport system substrate-binding protein